MINTFSLNINQNNIERAARIRPLIRVKFSTM
jgi:hypothetical protein